MQHETIILGSDTESMNERRVNLAEALSLITLSYRDREHFAVSKRMTSRSSSAVEPRMRCT